MKRTHSVKQLLHLFCNVPLGDLEGFKTLSGNIYVQNRVLYSYGAHYPMAIKTNFGEGAGYREIILINANNSTVTTEKHKLQLRQSTKPGQIVFNIPNIGDPRAEENIISLENNIVNAMDHILRRHKYWDFDSILRQINTYELYSNIFGIRKLKIDADFLTVLQLIARETEEKNAVKEKIRHELEAEKLKQLKIEWAPEVALWYKGENTKQIPLSMFKDLGYDPVRVSGNVVESVRGANVYLEDARIFCKYLQKDLISKGAKIGPFEVLDVSKDFVQIGCHKINKKQAIKAVLGV